MEQSLPVHPFEEFPREDLFPGISRRQLISTLLTEVHVLAGKNEGAKAIKIPSLGSMADDELYDLIPAIKPGTRISINNKMVCASLDDKTEPIHLFEMEPIATDAFNQVNGKNTLHAIASHLAENYPISIERAFAFTRGLFLTLVKAEVCLPAETS